MKPRRMPQSSRSADNRIVQSQHWLDIPAHGLIQHQWADGSAVSFRDPNISFEDSRVTAMAAGHLATVRAEAVLGELQKRMLATNPLRFYLLIDALQRLIRMSGARIHGYDPLQELVGGVLTSLDPCAVMAARNTTITADDFTAMELLVRQLVTLETQSRIGDFITDADERDIDARILLAAEEQFDRNAGYSEALRIVANDVLTQLDDLIPEIGFRIADAVRAADAHVEDQLARLEVALPANRQDGPLSQSTTARTPLKRLTQFEALELVASVNGHDPLPVIARALNLGTETARALLDALATPLGSQQVRGMTSRNRLRQFPVVKLPDETYVWASPHDSIHDVLEWAELYLAEHELGPARTRLSRARARSTERLTATALAGAFGTDRVVRNLEYQDTNGNWVETDVVVDLGDAAVVVEAKSQRITVQGRHADPGRVRTKVEEFLLRPLAQTERARRAFLHGCNVRGKTAGASRMKPTVVRRLIVNLDRVDPFVTHARDLVGTADSNSHQVETDAWIVSLADFLAVAHLLPTSTELWGYHGKRAAQTAQGSPVIYSEADALGAWLKSREGAWPVRQGEAFDLSFSAGPINAYFTARDRERRRRAPGRRSIVAPSSGIPPQVLAAMDSLTGAPDWGLAADAIADVSPAEWSKFRRDIRRFGRKARSRHQNRARAAAERGTVYEGAHNTATTVTIRPGAEALLEMGRDDGNTPAPSATSAQRNQATNAWISLTVARPLPIR